MRTRVAIGLVAVLAILGIGIAKRHDAARFVFTHALALATGYDVRLADERIGTSHAALIGLALSERGRTVFASPRVDVWYSLRDLLPGSRRRFGLVGVSVERPTISLVKYADGTYDVPIPRERPSFPALPPAANPIPVRCFIRVVHGAGSLQAQGEGSPLVVREFDVAARIDTAGRTHYVVTGTFASRAEPFTVRGTSDVTRGFAMHRFTASVLPLSALANALIDSKSVAVLAGTARNFDARVFAVADPGTPFSYHYSLGFDLGGGRLALPGLIHPVDAIAGRLELYDSTFFIEHLRASLVGIPLRAEGAIFNFAEPQIRIGVTGSGDMARLRTAFRFSVHQPLAGPIHLAILVEGSLGDPSVVANATSPRMYYRGFPFDALDAGVVYYHDVVALAPLRFRYGGVTAVARASLEIGEHILERMDLHFTAPADRLPYAGALMGSEPLVGDASLYGKDLLVDVVGSLAARSGIDAAAAMFDFHRNGIASVEPFWMRAGNGEVDAGFRLDRLSGTSAFWIAGNGIAMKGGGLADALPNLTLPQMPPIEGKVTSIGIVGGERSGAIELAGGVAAAPATIASVPFSRLSASFDGTLGGASISRVAAAGPWGSFTGSGTFSGSSILMRGSFDGTLGALQPVMDGIPARGGVRGDVAIGVVPSGIFVQAADLRMQGASVDGVPVASADGSLLFGNGAMHVYSAHVAAAGGDVVAAGSFGTAGRDTGRLDFIGTGVQAASLRGLGVPLSGGRLAFSGSVSKGPGTASIAGTASIDDGIVAGHTLSGTADVGYTGSQVAFDHVVAAMDGVYGYANGTISFAHGTVFDLHAQSPAGDIATALRGMRVPSYSTQGTFDADVRIGGSPEAPSVVGTIGIPAGNVNGLPFVDGSAAIAARPGSVVASDGSVLVGTTHAQFSAGLEPGTLSLDLRAPSAAFDDFNNFFDTGDTLGGSGSIAFGLTRSGRRVATHGDIDVRGFRYRSLPIGDTRAAWSSRRNVVQGRLAVGGAEGLLSAHGSIAISPQADWETTLKRSRYDMSANVDDLDLGLWVSVIGFPQVPITGRAFGAATMVGTYPALRLEGNATLRDGTVGRFPIRTFDVAFGSRARRLAIERLELQGPGLTATASGTVGLHRTDPIDMRLVASTDDLPAFLAEVTHAHVPVSGAFSGTLHVGGNFDAPILDATLTAQQVHVEGVPVATLFGSVRLQGNQLELYDAGATFTRGSVHVSGDIPLHLKPFALPENTPVKFALDASDVDASVFDAVFGHGTKLGGLLSTHVAVAGTIEDPHMSGEVTVSHGSYSSDLDEAPITNALGMLTFEGSQISVQRFEANAGSGSVALSGHANVGGAAGPSFDGAATLRGAQFASPVFGSATIDGAVTIGRTTSNALLAGDLTMTNTTIPFAAFVGGAGGPGSGVTPSWPIAFDLKLKAGQNVRVRGSGYGAGLDISGTGSAVLGGTLSAPTLGGSFVSTGGSLTYFDRSFRVLEGSVSFDPANGLMPTLHAVAMTNVVNPDPDVARNPFGSATITIDVDGPLDHLKIGFTSDPSGYSRDQILAMLAPFGGFISGIQFNPYEVTIPGGAAAVVSNAPVPGGVFVSRNGSLTMSQEAFSILNAQFASSLLAPVENVLGQTLGVSDVNLTLGYFGNVGVSVRRVLGKTVSAVYSSTFGLPNRQSFGIRFSPNELNAAALSFFYQTGQLRLFESPGEIFGPVLLGQPLEGQSGFSFTFQHFFR